MEKIIAKGPLLFGVVIAALGVVSLFCAFFGLTISGVPWVFEKQISNDFSGSALLAAGICVAANLRSQLISTLLGYFFLACVLFRALPQLFAHPDDWSLYGVLAEALASGASAWTLAQTKSRSNSRWESIFRTPAIAGPYLFAASLIVFGSIHFIVAHFIASLIPAWIPGHLFLTWLTGTAMVASAIIIALGRIVFHRLAQWAGFLLGIMFLLWFVLLHIPRVAADPRNPDEWSSAFICLAMCGGSWIIACWTQEIYL